MKKTGELLKQKREGAGLSLSEVALATKINPKVLSAIEAGDESNLPAKTILKGFVRSYALFLKMEVEDVVRTFIEETGGPAPSPVHDSLQKGEGTGGGRAVNEESSAGLRTAAVVLIVLLIGLIIGIRELVDKYQREKVAASTPAEIKVSPLGEEGAPAKAAAETTAAVAEATPAEPPAATATASLSSILTIPKILEIPVHVKHEPASESAPEPVEIAKAEVPEVEPAKTEPVKAEPVKTEPAPEVAGEDAKTEEPAKPTTRSLKNEVIIEALDRVEVKFQLAGESKTVALAPNEVQVIRADGAVTLDFSDGGAVSLVHNGRVRGVPGKLGEPKQVKLQ